MGVGASAREFRRTVGAALAGVVLLGVLAGCGEPPAPPARVRLTVTDPHDTAVVKADTVTVVGTVRPAGSRVLVRGQAATVRGATFRATVALDPGATVIDVLASSPNRRPAVAALRVTRRDLVRIPQLAGSASADEARDRLAGLGLNPQLSDEDGFFTGLLPVGTTVCSTDPPAGTEVESGTSVAVRVSKLC